MTTREKVEAEIKQAMKSREQERLSALRMIKAEFLVKEKETGEAIDDDAADETLRSMLKKYKKSKEEYKTLGKQEEAEHYERDIKTIESFLSAPMMDEEQVAEALKKLVAELGITGPQDFGKAMKAFMAQHPNADGKVVSTLLKGLLNP